MIGARLIASYVRDYLEFEDVFPDEPSPAPFQGRLWDALERNLAIQAAPRR